MDMSELTMRELRDLQKVLGIPLEDFEKDAFGLTAGIAWLLKRREDKSFTFEQALDMKQHEIEELVGAEDPKG